MSDAKAILFVYVDFFFENLSILRANEIKINGTIPLCIGPQDCQSRVGRGTLKSDNVISLFAGLMGPILWFRILWLLSVENIKRLCVFMFQT